MKKETVTPEEVDRFINGHDPMERIVNLEYSYRDDFIRVFYRNEKDEKCMSKEDFYPFLWATKEACRKLCRGDKRKVKELLNTYKIRCVGLDATNKEGEIVPEMENGYTVKFQSAYPMALNKFLDFFRACENPVFEDKKNKDAGIMRSKAESNQYLMPTPKEQYLIETGRRYFKGYNDYNELLRMVFDLETTGLDTKKDRIEQFGIWFNRPVIYNGEKYEFRKIYAVEGNTEEEKDASELYNIRRFIKIIYTFRPDIITAHNGEAFDWCIIEGACQRLGTTLENESKPYFDGQSIHKDIKESVLKLGGEVETFHRTIVPNTIVTDSLHAVRRAQAVDSNMMESNLKYATKYLGLVKKNRVYVPGDLISKIWNDFDEHYAFNDENGDWYIYDSTYVSNGEENITIPKKKNAEDKFVLVTRNYIKEGYSLKSGHYIVGRYLLDDLWECDAVEAKMNSTNFLICKLLPEPFEKCCTMGTAGQWKALMMGWSYERNLAIPSIQDNSSFTGGLSRLLSVGYIDNVVKLDYNSLYPSIILTWGITTWKDLSGAMLSFLNYMLTNRETYKKYKKQAGKIADKYEERLTKGETLTKEEADEYNKAKMDYEANDKKQAQLKVLCNSFFGAFGAQNGNVYPWSDVASAERTTCTGRMCLRLMISHFKELGYSPIVGDSFTEDTPLFVKYKKNNLIDIKPIGEIFNTEKSEIDDIGREYDYSAKEYYVLCRSGWVEPSYIYRHKTDKDIYEVTDRQEGTIIDVTEDHSLYNDKKEKIKPSTIDKDTKLEYYQGEILPDKSIPSHISMKYLMQSVRDCAAGVKDRVPVIILNGTSDIKKNFYRLFYVYYKPNISYSKTLLAGLNYLKK